MRSGRFAFAVAITTTAVAAGVLSPMAPAGASSRPSGTVPLLRVGTTYLSSNLDPTKSGGGTVVGALGLETVLTLGPQDQLEPDLATSWDQTGPVTYVYHLRHGVKFWDGSELTAADVVYSWDYERAPGSQDSYGFTSVKSITAAGPYSVVVTLTHPDASWQYTPAYNGQIFEKKFAEAHKGTFGQPGVLVMGTGPWVIDSFDPTTGSQLSANPNWWGGKVPIQHISFKFFTSDTPEELAFRAGELDVDPFILGPKSFQAASGVRLVSAPSCLNAFVSMNTQVAPWNDIHVRRAVAYALNRSDIIDANGGYAVPDYTLIPSQVLRTIASQAQVDALLKSLPLYQYNLAKARAEMAKSAYPHGFNTTLLEFVYGSVVNISQVVASELQKIGIHATIKALTLDAWEAAETGPVSQRQTSFSTGGCEGPDVSGYDHYIGSLGQFNLAGYVPAAVDKLVAAGLATTKPAQRFAIYSKLLQRVATDVPYVPLYVDEYTVALDNKFVIPAFNQPAFQFDDWALQLKPAA